MRGEAQERKLLKHLERIYDDTEGIIRINRIKQIAFLLLGLALMFSGMLLSKQGVIQGLCDILICLSGASFAYAFFFNAMSQTNRLLAKYTKLDRDSLNEHVSDLPGR